MAEHEKKFPPLYGLDKNGKIKEWTIQVTNKGTCSELFYTYGYLNGKKVECKLMMTHGKNVGKKNETTHFQQAIHDAQSKWNKKHDIDGYIESLDKVMEKLNRQVKPELHDTIPLPMLSQEFKKHMNKVRYPCYVQPKLDGYRMIFNPVKQQCYSRTGKEFTVLYTTELYKELVELQSMLPNTCLDGELYVHDSCFDFENYGVLRKQKALTPKEATVLEKIEYHIYDIIDTTKPFVERLQLLEQVERLEKLFTKIRIVPTIHCTTLEHIQQQHMVFVSDGYEGSIIRNAIGMYRCKFRSFDLLKYKDFDDAEFTIVGYTSETDITGTGEPLIIWICETEAGNKFHVQSKGTREQRRSFYKMADQCIGKKLWVQYFGLTTDGIPRFPKTKTGSSESIRTEMY